MKGLKTKDAVLKKPSSIFNNDIHQGIYPYAMIQPCMKNRKEYKVVVYIPSKSIICVSSARTTSGHYKKVFPTGQNHCDLFTFVIPSRSLSPYHLRSTISCWRFYESSWWFYREWVWKSGSGVLKCTGREKKWSQNLNFLRLRGAKSQNWFASTHFLRPEIANSLWSRKKS